MSSPRISVAEAARLLGCSAQFLRIGLQRGKLPFGTAINMIGSRWTYYIHRGALMDYIERGRAQ